MARMPGADDIPLVVVEVGMILSLSRVFRITLTEAGAKSILGGFVGTDVGRGVFQFLGGWIPGAGNALNAFTAAGVVEAIGCAVAADFSHRPEPPSLG
ncbi:hypothetical protein [Catenuloplanes indicus]|uniref:Uncharacterized protein (DUF697 family) n=1 Tax=Catenuloplanes indicus TaxID=137267 RepID=A0AAE4B3U8_9ACTN|nr:hypothetical protein [Catenuloplanes indicus]MDQ0370593.1 uncharacterized protein (DUF697 family) [Catenuloplanes indicus]